MSTSLVTLPVTRHWGGVKIPFDPPMLIASTLNCVVNFPYAIQGARVRPTITYKTNVSDEVELSSTQQSFSAVLNLPIGTNELEFRVSLPNYNDLLFVTSIGNTSMKIGFVLTADAFNTVFPDFGTQSYNVGFTIPQGAIGLRLSHRNADTASADDVTIKKPYLAPVALDATYKAHYTAFAIGRNSVSRSFNLKIKDINDRALTDGLSEGDLPLYPWPSVVAPWPAFSAPSNVVGEDYTNGQNFMVYYTTLGAFATPSVLVPCSGNLTTGFVVPADAAHVIIRRVYLTNTVANALAAAKVVNPNIIGLNDCVVFEFKDGATPNFLQNKGANMRMPYKARIAMGVSP